MSRIWMERTGARLLQVYVLTYLVVIAVVGLVTLMPTAAEMGKRVDNEASGTATS